MSKAVVGGWIGLAILGCLGAGAPPQAESVTVSGLAMTLAEALRPTGLELDPDPAATQVVVKGEDGSITPLLADDASRGLFRDKRLRDRRVEVRGKRFAGSPFVQVYTYKVEEGGVLKTPEYHCEICRISVRSPQACPCCQGPMDLRMKPEEP